MGSPFLIYRRRRAHSGTRHRDRLGWAPALLWIVLGVIFMGAAHDFGALVLSMRHEGKSVGRLAEVYISPRSRTLFLIIIFFLIWMVGAVFAFAIASLFVKFPASILPVNLEIAVAIGLGYFTFKKGGHLMLPSVIILIGLYLVIFGTATGQLPSPAEDSLFRDLDFWLIGLMIYAFVASSLPVWLLLQPRDLINSHQLIVGLIAMYLGFAIASPTFQAPAVGPLEQLPSVIPLLFVTIACGAISGFHGLVSSGTTSKQLCRATDARPIGYGAMLCEASLAILATMAVAAGHWVGAEHSHAFDFVMEKTQDGSSLPTVPVALGAFINGAAGFLGSLGLPQTVGVTMVAVLVISFAATSLDTALRIQRLVLSEIGDIYRIDALKNRWVGGALATLSVLVLIYVDKAHGAKSLWPVFGATNQVLAAFTLLICALYLRKRGVNSRLYAVPAVFIMTLTISAMVFQITRDLAAGHYLVGLVGLAIAVVTLWIALEAALAWRRRPESNHASESLPERELASCLTMPKLKLPRPRPCPMMP